MLAVTLGMGCVGCAVDNPAFGMSDGEDGGFGTTDADDAGADDGLMDGAATEGDPDAGDADPDGTAGADGGDPDAGDDDDDDDDDDDVGDTGGLEGGEDTGPPLLDGDGGDDGGDDGSDGGDDGDDLACPSAVTVYPGTMFSGRIEVEGLVGYEAAQAHCEARADARSSSDGVPTTLPPAGASMGGGVPPPSRSAWFRTM